LILIGQSSRKQVGPAGVLWTYLCMSASVKQHVYISLVIERTTDFGSRVWTQKAFIDIANDVHVTANRDSTCMCTI